MHHGIRRALLQLCGSLSSNPTAYQGSDRKPKSASDSTKELRWEWAGPLTRYGWGKRRPAKILKNPVLVAVIAASKVPDDLAAIAFFFSPLPSSRASPSLDADHPWPCARATPRCNLPPTTPRGHSSSPPVPVRPPPATCWRRPHGLKEPRRSAYNLHLMAWNKLAGE